jgi:adenosylcobinamide-GDP ribazoletransferase
LKFFQTAKNNKPENTGRGRMIIDRMKGFVTAMRTLTIIPVPGPESKTFSSALTWFPVVGLILGLILFALGKIWTFLSGTEWPGGGAMILLASEVVLTRGFHLDGLADWADSLGGKRDRESKLAIMKDSHIGAFGVIALIMVLLGKWIALKKMLIAGSTIWLLCILIVSRDMMVFLMTTLPYARSHGGIASPFIEDVRALQRIGAHGISIAICLVYGPAGFALYGIGRMITGFLASSFRKDFGGFTGDLLGTTNEVVETLLLWVCVIAGRLMVPYTGWNWLFS